MIMKKYLIVLKITCGEYDFTCKSVQRLSSRANPERAAIARARGFYGKADKRAAGDAGFYFNGGEVYVEVKSVVPLTDAEAAVLEKFI
jgi:hypothetical protein